MTATTIPTYWAHSVYAIEDERDRLLVTGFSDTPGEALAAMYSDCTYYQSECGYSVRASLSEICATCQGTGQVPKKRPRLAYKTCPACKGAPRVQQIDSSEMPSKHVAYEC